jgi:iron complex outermembrane receptor protein
LLFSFNSYICNVVAFTYKPLKIFFSIVLLFVSYSGFSQLSLSGKVSEILTGNPIPGASVYIHDLKKGVVTDLDGNYLFNNLPRGKFLVQFESIGFSTKIQLVDVALASTFDIALTSAVTELNEVVISGVSYSTELKKNPVPIATMNQEALNAAVSTNLIDKVSRVPGVSQIATGPAISKPVIRGLGYNRIITLYDGIRQEGQQWGDEHGIEIDEFSVDRVEVIKGAGSLMYGSDGLGGVINFLAPNPVSEGVVESRFISNYQSNNRLFANSLMNAGNMKGIYWNGRISNKKAQPYLNNYDGHVFNSGYEELDYNLLFGVNRSWGYSQINASIFDQTLGLVEGERDEQGKFMGQFNDDGSEVTRAATEDELNTYHIFIPRQNVFHQKISNTTNIFKRKTRIQLNAGLQNNKRKEFGDVINANDPSLYFDLTTGTYSAMVFLPEVKSWNFSVGASGMLQQNKNRGSEFLIPEYTLSDVGFVTFVKKNIKHVDLAGGVRYDHRSLNIASLYLDENGQRSDASGGTLKFDEAQLGFSGISASGGITLQANKHITLKSNISRGYRAPNISELASNGRHEGSLRYEYGNYHLKPEHSLQADAGLVISTPHFTTEFSVFQNNIGNYIYTEKLTGKNGLDSIADPDEPVPVYQYVQGNAQLNGGEISIDVHPHPLDWLHVENSLSMVYGTNRDARNDSARYLPFIPAPRLQSEIRATAKRWKRLSNLFVKLQYEQYWKQDRVLLENRTETVTPGYYLWNAGLGFDLNNLRKKSLFTFYLTVINIFDHSYQNNLSRLKYASENPLTGRVGVFNMGRNISFKLLIPMRIANSKKS